MGILRVADDLQLEGYDYALPEKFIAQHPADKRDQSKLLVFDRRENVVEHRVFSDIMDYLSPGDCVVINKTKVLPARLYCRKNTGGKIELFLLKKISENSWTALCRENVSGKELILPDGNSKVKVVDKNKYGEYILEFMGEIDIYELMNKYGHSPLPPYIKRHYPGKEERYQTVYAESEGAVAAPTAGLHFTLELMKKIKAKGIEIEYIVLHIGWATFKPVSAENINEHKMLPEYFEITKETADKINSCRQKDGRIIAVGTSTVRALESQADVNGNLIPGKGETELYIYPGYKFKVIDAMLTNFHLPKSTNLILVSAFAGKEKLLSLYKSAMENNYRFYSYGDAMLVL
ncbi:MAG: tRNA preQ1(34) S-adenosylmethionine ribosyltransferase-isomerase QueA [Elusimicrobia bacterium CG1_02_37_114]|nr:MAG: tRNA preQ1(34) S-adenosylmethionine ribosyltransferase-isomerase QueA [Elusimicrobia bacterium CG1_02_37_114]PIV53048.1 MAG: tRNA preQ1(34) S-adenosylmethionine ribosyltransferase-isomerase QueA [Elusimicrobia bacterium CG02_land_8_20_14_3_00_37_13]PIZ12553.1 MAG: tRNA preQ1(34) S-adenosylmethionine ribosyltransferase-isomerase QueA [Elusimicrobia bacterium CG_4_10_14_0_8_um_filter_37_32]